MSSEKFSRRDFFKAGAATAIGTSIPTTIHAQKKGSANTELLNIGLILGGGNHSQNMWARLINAVPNANNISHTPRRTGMVFTHVWSVIPEWAKQFAKTFGVKKVVKRFDDMVGKVDGIFVDSFFGTPYNHHFSKPFIEARIPIYVNRPFADSVGKAKKMVELAEKYKTPIMTGSSFEHLESTMSVKNRYPFNTITSYEAYNSTSDFYSHGVHGLLLAYAAAGGGIEAVSHSTESWIKGGGVTHVVYKDRGKGPFIGKIYDRGIDGYLCGIRVNGSKQFYGFGQCDWDQFMWIHLLQKIQMMFETGSMPDTHEQIVEKTAMFVGAFRSIIHEKGNLVSLSELDDDWKIGVPWGHSGNPTKEEIDGYSKLFGEEKGELQPDKTYG